MNEFLKIRDEAKSLYGERYESVIVSFKPFVRKCMSEKPGQGPISSVEFYLTNHSLSRAARMNLIAAAVEMENE